MDSQKREPSPVELIDFAWPRLSSPTIEVGVSRGHEVRSIRGEDGVLTEPFANASLFREFASLDGSEQSLLRFAADHGLLGLREYYHVDGDTEEDVPWRNRESVERWQSQRYQMALAVRLFNALKSGTTSEVIGTDIITRPLVGKQIVFAKGALLSDVESALGEEDGYSAVLKTLRWPDDEFLIDVIERGADDRKVVQTVLSYLVEVALHRHVVPTVARDGKVYGTGLRLTFAVESLIGAMWLQMALAIDGNRDYAVCPVCGTWWDRTDARSHKEVCSDGCRAKRSYDKRRAQRTEGGQ